jgi:DNA-binding GntR family transcriptional regulator
LANQSPIARHQVREELQRRILSGETRPGERLTQQSLARELGVAQGTVRESLLEMQWLGLVDSVDRLGVFVGNLDADLLCEAYQVRELLEGLASRSACMHAARADIAELRAIADNICKLAGQGKLEEIGTADRAFHLQIMRLSRNRILLRLAEGYRVLSMAVHASRDPSIDCEEHLKIVDAIEHNLPDDAERIARIHVDAARRIIEQEISEGKFAPHWVMDENNHHTTRLKG